MTSGFRHSIYPFLHSMTPRTFKVFFFLLPKGKKTLPRGIKPFLVLLVLFCNLLRGLFPLEISLHTSSSSLLLQWVAHLLIKPKFWKNFGYTMDSFFPLALFRCNLSGSSRDTA